MSPRSKPAQPAGPRPLPGTALAVPQPVAAMPISMAMASPRDVDQRLLVGHQMFTAPPKQRAANAGSTVFSVVFHGALLAAAIYVTSLPATRNAVTETVSLIQITDD